MWRDQAYFLDILIAARRARAYSAGMDWAAFEQSPLHQDAIVRRLEIIGEAARNVSQSARDAHPEIPWRQVIGMRNRVIHEYFRVDLQKVWDVVQNDLPVLIAALERFVPPEDPT
jgi:uncharacterized protein with HEPN domain